QRADVDAALLTTYVAPLPPAPVAAPNVAIAPPLIANTPLGQKKAKKCKRGYKKRKVGGKVRCVKAGHKHHKKPAKTSKGGKPGAGRGGGARSWPASRRRGRRLLRGCSRLLPGRRGVRRCAGCGRRR